MPVSHLHAELLQSNLIKTKIEDTKSTMLIIIEYSEYDQSNNPQKNYLATSILVDSKEEFSAIETAIINTVQAQFVAKLEVQVISARYDDCIKKIVFTLNAHGISELQSINPSLIDRVKQDLSGIKGCKVTLKNLGQQVAGEAKLLTEAEEKHDHHKTIAQAEADELCDFGLYFYRGDGVKLDIAKAVKLFREAAVMQSARAQYNFGVCCLNKCARIDERPKLTSLDGIVRTLELKKAVKLLHQAASQGLIRAQFMLGFLCSLDLQEKDGRHKVEDVLLQLNVDQGSALVQFNLAIYYLSLGNYANASGASRSVLPEQRKLELEQRKLELEQGLKLLRQSASQGFAPAQYKLALLFWRYQSSELSAEAINLFRLAAAQEYGPALCYLATCYKDGTIVAKDVTPPTQAAIFFNRAAVSGDAKGQYNLGVCYLRGEGVEKDESAAVRLFSLAAEQGYVPAECELGFRYMTGKGIPKDAAKAAELFSFAAASGNAKGQYNLGVCYMRGDGVEKDEKEALRLYRLAAEQGHIRARRALDKIERAPSVISSSSGASAPFASMWRLQKSCSSLFHTNESKEEEKYLLSSVITN